jgi:hypothetical protein
MISSQRGRRVLIKLGLVLFGFFVGLTIAEVALRIIGYSYPEFYQPDQSTGYYSPDIVLFAVTTNNDITDNSRALKKADELRYFVYLDGRLVAWGLLAQKLCKEAFPK